MRMVVDLPAPFGPSSPKISPRRTAKETPATARNDPNVISRSRTSIARAGVSMIVFMVGRAPSR